MNHLFRNKKTKVLLWILGGVFAVFVAVFLYAYATGSLKSSADTVVTLPTFSDVPKSHWAYDAITVDTIFGIVGGYPDGTFKPALAVNREQAAVFMARAVAGGDYFVPAGPAVAHCSDVSPTNWAYKYVEYIYSQGVINDNCTVLSGEIASKYSPAKTLTRQDMAVLIAKAAFGNGRVPEGPATPTFSDVSTSNPAYKYIEFLASKGIASGYSNGTFRPANTMTRDQLSVFVFNAYHLKDLLTGVLVMNTNKNNIALGAIPRAEASWLGDAINSIPVPSAKSAYGKLTGTVTDKATGRPIANARVTSKCTNPSASIHVAGAVVNLAGTNTTVTTNDQGEYTLNLKTRTWGDFDLGGQEAGNKVYHYNITASAEDQGYSSSTAKNLSWGDVSNGGSLGTQDFKLEKGVTHLECNSSKQCKPVNGTGVNKCSKDSDCVTPSSPSPYTGSTGTLSGPVYKNGVMYKPSNPIRNIITFTLTKSGGTAQNYSGLVNTAGYLIKSTAQVDGHPDFLILPSGTYTATNVKLTVNGLYGTAIYNGHTEPASIVIPNGGRVDPKWLFTN